MLVPIDDVESPIYSVEFLTIYVPVWNFFSENDWTSITSVLSVAQTTCTFEPITVVVIITAANNWHIFFFNINYIPLKPNL